MSFRANRPANLLGGILDVVGGLHPLSAEGNGGEDQGDEDDDDDTKTARRFEHI